MGDYFHDSPTDATLALRALRRYPDRVAFKWDGGQMTYAETYAMIAGIQAELKKLGVGLDHNVGILSSNRAEAWCTVVATQSLGAAVCNLHPMGAAELHEAQIKELAPAAVVYNHDSHAEVATGLMASCPDPVFMALGGEGDNDIIARARKNNATVVENIGLHDSPASLNFTGGTTGRPKAVVRTARGVGQMTLAILADFNWPQDARYLAVAPISHVGGTKIISTLTRGGMIYMVRSFDPARVLELIEQEKISVTVLVPTMIYALLDHPDINTRDLSSLKALLYGAAPMSALRLKQGIERFGSIFAQFYGQTECYPITYLGPEDHNPDTPEVLLSCGRPVTGAQVVLLDSECNPVPQGTPGEICVRSPTALTHYRNRPEETAKTQEGGWLHTGDVAYEDEAGRLYIVDRKKDMIVSGGFNIYPKEVEDVIYEDATVSMAAVIGVPHEKWGEAVVAFVVPREKTAVDQAAISATLRERKGAIYVPKEFKIVDSLPLSPLGKIDKVALRAPYWEGQARNV